ncbi:hypothetical protein BH24GEM2_BH24GEM2_03120 [soil metagenome]
MKYLSAALPFILLGCVEMISSIRPVQQYEVEQAVQEVVLRELMRKMRPPGEVICIRVHYGDGPLYKQDPRREGAKWRAGECQDWVIP